MSRVLLPSWISVFLGPNGGYQTLTPFGATTGEYTPAAGRAHTSPETMTSLPLDIAGLIGPLHHNLRFA